MAKKDFTLTSKILMTLLVAGDVLVTPFELRRRLFRGEPLGGGREASKVAYYLYQKGLIKYVDKNNERFLKLTKKGQLKALLSKARLLGPKLKWDGKWRLIIFDIPEESRDKRDFFRWLLRQNNFYKLQGSVFISPYPLNREAVEYLKESKLIEYIRILKVEEMDDDKELRKKFDLNIK